MKKTNLFLLSASALLALASCNGISGAGRKTSSETPASEQSAVDTSVEPTSQADPVGPGSESQTSEEPSAEVPAIALPDGATTTVNIGTKMGLTATGFPGEVTWASSNKANALVSDNGEVTFYAPGEVTISATSGNAVVPLTFTAVDPDANKSGTCTGTDGIPSEIALGESIDLAEIIAIKNVSNFYLDSDSDTIEIEGHKVIAVKAGEFTFRIHLGRSRRSISGVVSSEDKIIFNNLVKSFDYNYSGMIPALGFENYVTHDGFMNLVDQETDEKENDVYYYGGSIYDYEKQDIYDFSVTLAPDYEAKEYAYTDFKVNKGYAKTFEKAGIVNWPEELNPLYFTETEIELVDKEENEFTAPAFYFIDNTEYQDVLNSFYTSMFGGGWSFFSHPEAYGVDGKGIVVSPQYDEETGKSTLLVYPCDANGEAIPYFTFQGKYFSSLAVIGAIGTTEIEPIDTWKENPVYPEPTDATALKTFFDAVTEKKTYTMEGGASWLDSGVATDAPKNMTFSDADFGPFPNFSVVSAVNEYGRTFELTDANNAYCIPEKQGDNYAWNTGAAWIEAVGAGKYYTAHGNRGVDDEDVVWETLVASDVEADFVSLWNPQLVLNPVPSWLATDVDPETAETFNLFDYTSITDDAVLEDGSHAFTLNTNGPDANTEIFTGAGYGGVLGNLLWIGFGFNWGYSLGHYLDMVEWLDEAVYTLTVSADGKSLTFDLPNVYNATIVYDVHFTITIVDEDPMGASAAAAIHSVNPDYVVPGEELPE